MPKAYWLAFAIGILVCILAAESFIIDESIALKPGTHEYPLIHQKIIHHSEAVFADTLQLEAGKDYVLSYKDGILRLLSLELAPVIHIKYLILPPHLVKAQYAYKYIDYTDSTQVLPPPKSLFTDAHNLEISGSKTFALSLSERGETELLQSLYVNLSGELAQNINIIAQLSDSQSRLSPEGDSKELSSLDQVFIKLYGQKWELGMGDLELEYDKSYYLSYHTKLEGIRAAYRGTNELMAAYNAGGGKSARITLDIIDGKQGPYYLSPNEFQRSFLVVAGSEEIFQNAKLLERGRDYYIDYAEGSVMFKSLVYSTDLISIYFQYAEENYRQSTYFLKGIWQFAGGLSLSHHLIRQNDNKSRALLFELSDADLDTLQAAGDRPAYVGGVSETEAGQGHYSFVVATDGTSYYEYAYGDSTAAYDIIFSFVGAGKGDYEEYASGKYRFVGKGEGAYLPVKRLIPPSDRSNFELGLIWENSLWHSAFDAMYSYNDLNSLSKVDDKDNHGAIFSWKADNAPSGSAHRLNFLAEHRLKNTYFFSAGENPEADFSLLSPADSLAQSTLDFGYGFTQDFWQARLSLRYRDLEKHFRQKALSYSQNSVPILGFIPGTRINSSISTQSGKMKSLLQYHDLELFWQYRIFRLRLSGLMNELNYEKGLDSRYQKLSPALELVSEQHFSSLAWIKDESAFRSEKSWQPALNSHSLQVLHNSSFKDHHLDLGYSRRQVEKPASDEAKNTYDLLNLNSSHQVFKGALSLYNNFQLNQTEFFPKIRDLIYVGQGQGYYDSTGVYIDGGDYIYEYISAPEGKLATEQTLYSSLYLKPALYLKEPLWQRLQADFSFSDTQNKGKKEDSSAAIGESSSIYQRHSRMQNFWLDLYRSRILAKINLEQSREEDFRYQKPEKSAWDIYLLKLESRDYFGINEALEIRRECEKESRYDSRVDRYTLKSESEKNFSRGYSLGLEMFYIDERGAKQAANDKQYTLKSIGISPFGRSVLTQKYRFSSRFSLAHNRRKGTDFLNFLPQKRAGISGEAQLLAMYRISNISSISIEYRMNSYPKTKSNHNLKLEFKAEL